MAAKKKPLTKKAKRGRPSTYSPELAVAICERIASGESVRTIAKDADMPDASQIYRWLADDSPHPDFREQYAHARARQADFHVEEGLKIADGAKGASAAGVAAARLRWDARRWYASKLAPKKYGEKSTTEVTGPEGGPLEVKTSLSIAFVSPP